MNKQDLLIGQLIYAEAKKYSFDGQWREYFGTVEQAGRKFKITAKFVVKDEMLTFKDLEIKPLERERIILN